jgi:hypothetical protein
VQRRELPHACRTLCVLTENPRRPNPRASAFQSDYSAGTYADEIAAYVADDEWSEEDPNEAAPREMDLPPVAYRAAPRRTPLVLTQAQRRVRSQWADVDRGAEDAVYLDDDGIFLADPVASYGAGYGIERGSTGLPPGRPTRGTNDADKARDMVERHVGVPVAELQHALGRGRKTPQQQALRERVRAAVRELRSAGRARPDALAAALGVNVATIHRLAADSNARKHRK